MTSKVKIHQSQMMSVLLISEHPHNSNKQDKFVYAALKESILESGFDEPILVTERKDKPGNYYVVSGNHRFRAAVDLGMDQLPVIIRNDWDAVEQSIQLVKRNYLKGKIDKILFTEEINRLTSQENLALDVVIERMGFEDAEAFSEFYKEEKKRERKAGAASVAAPQVKMLDDLGQILSVLFEKYGKTVPHSFLIFPQGGRNHVFIQSTGALKKTMDAIALKCVADGLDVNTVLGGLLTIAMHKMNFLGTKDNNAEIVKEGSVEGDDNPELLGE